MQVKEKFWDTYKVGVIYWPCVQTVNFAFVPARNQVIFVSFFSMLWSTFMAYMKHMEIERLKQRKLEKKEKKRAAKGEPKQP